MQTKIKKLITTTIALLLLLSLFAPALTFAMGSDTAPAGNGTTVYYQDDSHDEEDTHGEEDSHGEEDGHSEESTTVSEGNAGATITLTLIAGVLLIIFVVGIIGAVGLGVIGIGYAFISGGGED